MPERIISGFFALNFLDLFHREEKMRDERCPVAAILSRPSIDNIPKCIAGNGTFLYDIYKYPSWQWSEPADLPEAPRCRRWIL